MYDHFLHKVKYLFDHHQTALLIGTASVLLGSLQLLSPVQEPYFYTLLGLKALGLLIYTGIIMQKRGTTSAFLSRFCSLTANVDCLAVIRSRPLGRINMEDVGVVYFAGGFIILLTGMTGFHTQENTSILFWFSWLSIPYLLFALYYQYVVVKKWCTLCLSAWCVLAAEIVLSLNHVAHPKYLSAYGENILFIISVFLFSAVAYRVISRS